MATQTGSIDLKALKASADIATDVKQYFWHNTTDSGAGEGAGAHITEITREDFVADPDNGGGNTLITSDGMLVRNGTKVSAEFGDDEIVLYTEEGVPAFSVNSGGGSSEQLVDDGVFLDEKTNTLGTTMTADADHLYNMGNGDSFTIQTQIKLYTVNGQIIPGTFVDDVNLTKASSGTTTINRTVTDSRGGVEQISYTITYTAPATITIKLTSSTTSVPQYRAQSSLLYYAIVSNSRVNIASDDVLYDALDGVSWASLLDNDMLDLRAFIKKLLTSLVDFFLVDTHSFSYPAISSGSGSGARTATFSKSGYYPIGVMGFRTGNSAAVPTRFNLSSRSSGSATLSYVLRAVSAVSAGSGDVDILWVKE